MTSLQKREGVWEAGIIGHLLDTVRWSSVWAKQPRAGGETQEEPRSTEPLIQRSSGWCWAADTAGGGAGGGLSGLPKPLPTPHTQSLWPSPGQMTARQGSLPPAKRAGPSCFNQQSPERLSSLLLRMCPVRPAWDLESHRARPTHRPLLLLVQWKPRAWDSWTPSLVKEPLRQHLVAG